MPKKLRDIENDLALEKHQAAHWFGEHAQDLPPPVEEKREQVRLANGNRVNRFIPLDKFPEIAEDGTIKVVDPQTQLTTQGTLEAVSEEKFPESRWERIERVQAVLELMEEAQSDMLRRHVLWGETYNELRRAGESRQAVFQRYKRAKAAFSRLWENLYGEEL